jgi:hypothetical protein
VCAFVTTAALVLHVACAQWLAANDPFAVAFGRHSSASAPGASGQAAVMASLGVLALVRVFLLFAAPGWWLWLAVRTLFGRRRPR